MIETPTGWGLLFLIGAFTGTLAGVLGIGGGLLIVPILTFFRVPLVEATATSLVGVLLSSISGSVQNLRMHNLNWKVSLVLALFGIPTAQIGAWLGDRFPDALLSLAFAVLLLVTIYLMALRNKLKKQQESANQASANHELIQKTSGQEHSDPAAQSSLVSTASIGLLAGILSGLFGVGGGVVMVPLQMLMLQEGIKSAVRTSLGAIVPISISALVKHTLNHHVLWIPGICLGLGGILGAQVGTRLLPKLPDRMVNRLFRTFLIMLSVYMTIRGIRGWSAP